MKVNHFLVSIKKTKITNQCFKEKEGEGAKIEELEAGNGKQTGQGLGWVLDRITWNASR